MTLLYALLGLYALGIPAAAVWLTKEFSGVFQDSVYAALIVVPIFALSWPAWIYFPVAVKVERQRQCRS